MKTNRLSSVLIKYSILLTIPIITILLNSCSQSVAENSNENQIQELPVISIDQRSVTTYSEFTASLEGTSDIDIRPQVDGYLDKISVDEGAYVKKGQVLFKINEGPYREQLNSAKANLLSAKAAVESSKIQLDKQAVLVKNNVVSDVQLKSAQAAYDAAKANESQAEAAVQSAKINVGYTSIVAPADGYIGRIPFKKGSLVGAASTEPLTMLSETKEIHVYFSMSEIDFLKFKEQFAGPSVEAKIKQMPPVELLLADNSIYPQKGKVETTSGKFDKSTGTINFRAVFPNVNGLLRSGNTGRIRIPRSTANSMIVPREATFELQDKVFVFALADSNKVLSKPISILGTSGNYYLVNTGLSAGEKIVYAGLDRLRDGQVIKPQTFLLDSLLKTQPL